MEENKYVLEESEGEDQPPRKRVKFDTEPHVLERTASGRASDLYGHDAVDEEDGSLSRGDESGSETLPWDGSVCCPHCGYLVMDFYDENAR